MKELYGVEVANFNLKGRKLHLTENGVWTELPVSCNNAAYMLFSCPQVAIESAQCYNVFGPNAKFRAVKLS